MLLCVCLGIDHSSCQNVHRTKKWHMRCSLVCYRWCKNPSKCAYNSVYWISNDNWSICVLLPCSWVAEYSEFWLSSIPTAASVLVLDWLNSHNLQWFSQRTVIFPTAVVVNTICRTIYWVSGLSGGWYYWFNPATASTWEFNSTTQLPSHRRSNLRSECLSCM